MTITMSTIFFLTLFLTIPITVLVTWIFIDRRIAAKAKINQCPYRNACEQYDETETKAAAKRVAKLLLDNVESDIAYKEAVKVFIENHPTDEEKKDETAAS